MMLIFDRTKSLLSRQFHRMALQILLSQNLYEYIDPKYAIANMETAR